MHPRLRALLPLPFVLAFAAVLLLIGIDWGLPSRAADEYLFGQRPVPTGDQILSLTGGWAADGRVAADVDRDPLADRDRPIPLNDTDADRAALLLRYRLYSAQPDEMITFRALSRMRPGEGDLDPRLYQYGGLWIYPVGALLKVASILGWVHVTPNLAHYLDHPEDFARFYIVARVYSVLWGLIGVVVVYALAYRLARCAELPTPSAAVPAPRSTSIDPAASTAPTTAHPSPLPLGERAPERGGAGSDAFSPDRTVVATAAAMLFAMLPVTINLAHEAKPHLAGAVLVLGAVLTAGRYVDRPTCLRAAVAGAVAGAAGGMVLSGLVALVLPGVMVWLAAHRFRRRLADGGLALLVAAVVFCGCNPFLVARIATGDAVSESNLSNVVASLPEVQGHNERGVLSAIGASLASAGWLAACAVTWPIVVAGGGAAVVFVTTRVRSSWHRRIDRVAPPCETHTGGAPAQRNPTESTAWLLLSVAAAVYVPFIMLAKDRPAEFARFAAVGHIALLLGAVGLVSTLRQRPVRAIAWLALMGWVGLHGLGYVKTFRDDARGGSRAATARLLQTLHAIGYDQLLVTVEPAPYSMPPVDLHGWRIILVPAGTEVRALDAKTLVIRPVERPSDGRSDNLEWYTLGGARVATPMSFASRPFQITQMRVRPMTEGERRSADDETRNPNQ